MKYHWNRKAFGRKVGTVESAEEIESCPVKLKTLLASGMVIDEETKKKQDKEAAEKAAKAQAEAEAEAKKQKPTTKSKKEKDDEHEEGGAAKRP